MYVRCLRGWCPTASDGPRTICQPSAEVSTNRPAQRGRWECTARRCDPHRPTRQCSGEASWCGPSTSAHALLSPAGSFVLHESNQMAKAVDGHARQRWRRTAALDRLPFARDNVKFKVVREAGRAGRRLAHRRHRITAAVHGDQVAHRRHRRIDPGARHLRRYTCRCHASPGVIRWKKVGAGYTPFWRVSRTLHEDRRLNGRAYQRSRSRRRW